LDKQEKNGKRFPNTSSHIRITRWLAKFQGSEETNIKTNFKIQNRLLTWQVQTGNSSKPTLHGRHEMASHQLPAVTLYSFYLI
jgi:hypothetical protein